MLVGVCSHIIEKQRKLNNPYKMRAKCQRCGEYYKIHYKLYKPHMICFKCGSPLKITMVGYEKYKQKNFRRGK